jgi:hypothetical protein
VIPYGSAGAWILVALLSGIAVGVRLHSFIHFRKLRGILCEKCLRNFWGKYDDYD